MCMDGILYNIGAWDVEPGCIKIVYTAGYTDAEFAAGDPNIDASEIANAVLVEACRSVRRSFMLAKSSRGFAAGVLQSESLGAYSYSAAVPKANNFGDFTLSAETREMLSGFVNMGYQIGS